MPPTLFRCRPSTDREPLQARTPLLRGASETPKRALGLRHASLLLTRDRGRRAGQDRRGAEGMCTPVYSPFPRSV